MKRKSSFSWLVEAGILLLILWGGKLVWEHFGQTAAFNEQLLETSFQYWFWQQRGPDLAVQIGLIFAGALGIATLLPSRKDKKDE
jgi:hypothetical protein